MDFGICNYRRPFARFRLKMTSKMFAIGRFWRHDRLPDRILDGRNGKNPVFPGSSGSVIIDGPSLNKKKGCFGKWTWAISKNPKDIEQIIENTSKN